MKLRFLTVVFTSGGTMGIPIRPGLENETHDALFRAINDGTPTFICLDPDSLDRYVIRTQFVAAWFFGWRQTAAPLVEGDEWKQQRG